jgi:hypothetical protein
MLRKLLRASAALAILSLLIAPLAVLAHEAITVGPYTIEYGWSSEPPTAGQDNAIVINISGAEEAHGEASGTIALLKPTDGETLQGDAFEVAVQIEGVDEHAEGIHWHLYVDDKVLTMAVMDQTTVTVNHLSNGAHTLKAVLADADHTEYGESVTAAITVEGATSSGEPSVSGLEATEEHGHDETAGINVDVSGLKLELVYGGQTTPLTLQPLKDGTPGQFTAPFTPERAGLYTLKITGKLSGDFGDTDVNVEVQPEEVQPGEVATVVVATTANTPSNNFSAGWLIAGVAVVLAGLGLGIFAFTRRK